MIALFSIITGALLYRWRGQAHPYKKYFPRPLNQIVFAAPYAAVTLAFWWPLAGYYALLIAGAVWILTTLGVLTGHGRGIDLGDTDAGTPERLEFLVKWLKPHVSLYWYDMALLSVTGLAVTLPAGLATANVPLALSGALKGPAYAVAKFGDTKVEGGELLTGAVLWGCVTV